MTKNYLSTATIEEMGKCVLDLREEIHHTWTTPDRMDSIYWASTEIHEALVAMLDEKRIYARNHEISEDSVYDELADTVMMLLTTMKNPLRVDSDYFYAFQYDFIVENPHIVDIMNRVMVSVDAIRHESSDGKVRISGSDKFISVTILMIWNFAWNRSNGEILLQQVLRKRLARIRSKHTGEIQ
jgi:hypothetical protein